jgi:pilus assembly protein Flp/PilA
MLNQIVMWPGLLFNWARDKFPRRDDKGASLVEYALLLALISVVAIGALVFLGHTVSNTVNQVGHAINSTNSVNTP